MVNTLGYPNGRNIIDYLEAGSTIGAGILEYRRYQNYDKSDPTLPSAGVNASFHVGIGLTDRIDVTGKLLNLNWFYKPEYDIDQDTESTNYAVKIDNIKLISAGLKVRYNLVKEVKLVPLLFSFGGIILGLQMDYMKGEMDIDLKISDTRTITYNTLQTTATGSTSNIGSLEWQFFTVTPDILLYFDFLYFISIFTGPGLAINYGTMDLQTAGFFSIDNSSSGNLAGGTINIDYELEPYRFMPKWTLGFEINLWLVKIHAEASSMLKSPTQSFMTQIGVRMEL